MDSSKSDSCCNSSSSSAEVDVEYESSPSNFEQERNESTAEVEPFMYDVIAIDKSTEGESDSSWDDHPTLLSLDW